MKDEKLLEVQSDDGGVQSVLIKLGWRRALRQNLSVVWQLPAEKGR